MKKFARLTAVLIVLLAFSGLAAAAGPEPGPFSTTGYTTNLVPSGLPDPYPPVVPSEFEFLPNGYTKFHIREQGEPGGANNAFCVAAYGAMCDAVCSGFTARRAAPLASSRTARSPSMSGAWWTRTTRATTTAS